MSSGTPIWSEKQRGRRGEEEEEGGGRETELSRAFDVWSKDFVVPYFHRFARVLQQVKDLLVVNLKKGDLYFKLSQLCLVLVYNGKQIFAHPWHDADLWNAVKTINSERTSA